MSGDRVLVRKRLVGMIGVVSLLGLGALAGVGSDASPPAQASTFPGTNGQIAFTSQRDGGFAEIYSMDSDGTNQTRLTTNAEIRDTDPQWSPDGTKIVFISDRDGNNEIYVMDADGGNQTRLTTTDAGEFYPSWSPDGAKIVFGSDVDGDTEIYVMDAVGPFMPTKLTDNSDSDEQPSWSPDGKKIVFVRSTQNTDIHDVIVMDADGMNPTNLTNNVAAIPVQEPSWSPDGTKIVWAMYPNAFQPTYEIFVTDAVGPFMPTNLTNNDVYDLSPSWSPDGTKIAFNSERDGPSHIYSMDADGMNPTRLTVPDNDFDVVSWGTHPNRAPVTTTTIPAGSGSPTPAGGENHREHAAVAAVAVIAVPHFTG